jgi:hypothetical protein
MRFGESGSDWIEVERSDAVGSEASWSVVSSFGGKQVRAARAFGRLPA